MQNCTWRTSPTMRAKRTRRWHISKSTSQVGETRKLHLRRLGPQGADLGVRAGGAAHIQFRGFAAAGDDTPMLTCSGCRVERFCSADHQMMASKKAVLGGNLGGTRISAEYSASGARSSKTVWHLTPALQTWWRCCSDVCAMPQRRRGSARCSSLMTGHVLFYCDACSKLQLESQENNTRQHVGA